MIGIAWWRIQISQKLSESIPRRPAAGTWIACPARHTPSRPTAIRTRLYPGISFFTATAHKSLTLFRLMSDWQYFNDSIFIKRHFVDVCGMQI